MDSLDIQRTEIHKYDTEEVSSDFLISSINDAFDEYRHSPVHLKVSFSVFCNYVLPYRISFEALNSWRSYFNKRYTAFLNTFDTSQFTTKEILKYLSSEQSGWYFFDYSNRVSGNDPFMEQTIDNILALKTPWSCEDYAIYYLYLFRSLGIPSAYEMIPLFGKFNYGHTETSVMFEDGKFYPAQPYDREPFKYQIAKMYRRTFEIQKTPFNEIRKYGEAATDIPDYFNMDHCIDVTGERTPVSSITVDFDTALHHKIFYICVYNGGEWKPVDWAGADTEKKTATFNEMGRKILYHLAYEEEGQIHLSGFPFVLDTVGNIRKLVLSGEFCNVRLIKYDRNAFIQPEKQYDLYFWQAEKSAWELNQSLTTSFNGAIFRNVPQNALLLLRKHDKESEEEPGRPFTYENGKQIWW